MACDLYALDKLEARNRARFIEEIFLGHVAQAKILPPVGFFFSAVPVEQVRNPPACPLFRRAVRSFQKYIGEQSLPQGRNAPFPFAHRLRGFGFLWSWPGDIDPLLRESLPLLFQPVAQPERRYTIFPVVALDCGPNLWCYYVKAAKFQRLLHDAQAAACIQQVDGAREAIEL